MKLFQLLIFLSFSLIITVAPLTADQFGLVVGEKVEIRQESEWSGKDEPVKTFTFITSEGDYEVSNTYIYLILAETETIYAAYKTQAVYTADNYLEYHILYFLDKQGKILKAVPFDFELTGSYCRHTRFLSASIGDINSDGDRELVLISEYAGGFSYSDGFKYTNEAWFNIDRADFLQELSYRQSGGGSLVEDYIQGSSLKLIDSDKDGFNEIIQITKQILLDQDRYREDAHGEPEPVAASSYYKFREDTGYGLFKSFPASGRLNDSRVRLREEPDLSSDTISFLTKGDKVLILDMTLNKQIIDGAEFRWYRVRTQDYKTGWTYGQFIDEIKAE